MRSGDWETGNYVAEVANPLMSGMAKKRVEDTYVAETARCVTHEERDRSPDHDRSTLVACFQQNSRPEVRLTNGDGLISGALTNAPGAQQQNYVYSLTPALNCAESNVTETDTATTLTTTERKSGDRGIHVLQSARVRRLTATECERLQGFPDGYTAITYRGKPAADSPRIAALGNSMAVPVVRWIGERIQRFVFGG